MCTIATLTNGRVVDRADSRAVDRADSRAVNKEVCREVQQGSLLFISATLEHLFRKTVTPNNGVHLRQT